MSSHNPPPIKEAFQDFLKRVYPKGCPPEHEALLFKTFMSGVITLKIALEVMSELPDEQAAQGIIMIYNEVDVLTAEIILDAKERAQKTAEKKIAQN